MNFLKKMLGFGPGINYDDLVKRRAMIVDVRTPGEYVSGHISGSINIPLSELQRQLKQLPDKQRPVITCCASGMRSASAKSILRAQGYAEVINGGSWQSLRSKLSQKR